MERGHHDWMKRTPWAGAFISLRWRPAAKHDIKLELSVEGNIKIRGDAMTLKLAINNLLENAPSFSPDNSEILMNLVRTKSEVIY